MAGLPESALPLRAAVHPSKDVAHEARVSLSLLAAWLFPHNVAADAVSTSAHFPANPAAVWESLLFYEDVSGRAPLLLRLLLPLPLRTEGDKSREGADVCCRYRTGYLVKRMLVVDAPRLVRFQVVEQHIGMEGYITALEGSHEFSPSASGAGTEATLTTLYRGHLRPRFVWRPLERLLVHQLHRYILQGMRALVLRGASAALVLPMFAESSAATSAPPGVVRIALHSHSRP